MGVDLFIANTFNIETAIYNGLEAVKNPSKEFCEVANYFYNCLGAGFAF